MMPARVKRRKKTCKNRGSAGKGTGKCIKAGKIKNKRVLSGGVFDLSK